MTRDQSLDLEYGLQCGPEPAKGRKSIRAGERDRMSIAGAEWGRGDVSDWRIDEIQAIQRQVSGSACYVCVAECDTQRPS